MAANPSEEKKIPVVGKAAAGTDFFPASLLKSVLCRCSLANNSSAPPRGWLRFSSSGGYEIPAFLRLMYMPLRIESVRRRFGVLLAEGLEIAGPVGTWEVFI